ncbi:MAG TPA: hypothetical protein VIG24_01620 [Acidimicrobiia bacterium]
MTWRVERNEERGTWDVYTTDTWSDGSERDGLVARFELEQEARLVVQLVNAGGYKHLEEEEQ